MIVCPWTLLALSCISSEKERQLIMTTKLRYPTPDELYAIERAARRARNAEVARLLHVGANALASGIARAAAALKAKEVRHA
jgi:hypothetical protein